MGWVVRTARRSARWRRPGRPYSSPGRPGLSSAARPSGAPVSSAGSGPPRRHGRPGAAERGGRQHGGRCRSGTQSRRSRGCVLRPGPGCGSSPSRRLPAATGDRGGGTGPGGWCCPRAPRVRAWCRAGARRRRRSGWCGYCVPSRGSLPIGPRRGVPAPGRGAFRPAGGHRSGPAGKSGPDGGGQPGVSTGRCAGAASPPAPAWRSRPSAVPGGLAPAGPARHVGRYCSSRSPRLGARDLAAAAPGRRASPARTGAVSDRGRGCARRRDAALRPCRASADR